MPERIRRILFGVMQLDEDNLNDIKHMLFSMQRRKFTETEILRDAIATYRQRLMEEYKRMEQEGLVG